MAETDRLSLEEARAAFVDVMQDEVPRRLQRLDDAARKLGGAATPNRVAPDRAGLTIFPGLSSEEEAEQALVSGLPIPRDECE